MSLLLQNSQTSSPVRHLKGLMKLAFVCDMYLSSKLPRDSAAGGDVPKGVDFTGLRVKYDMMSLPSATGVTSC